MAYGLTPEEADASLRFCVGRFTTEDDVAAARSVVLRGARSLGLAESVAGRAATARRVGTGAAP